MLESLQQYLTLSFSSNATYLIAYGVLFLVVILIMPRGVVPEVSDFLRRRRLQGHGRRGTRLTSSSPASRGATR